MEYNEENVGIIEIHDSEEYELGANIDERTNVFNMGAIAFGLFGGELDCSLIKWDAEEELYNVARVRIERIYLLL